MDALGRAVMADSGGLPPALAHYGFPVELGADTCHSWWVEAADGPAPWRSAASGALSREAFPDLHGFAVAATTTARQAVECTLGPTPGIEDLPFPQVRVGAPWEPTTFTDGALCYAQPWAPWLGLAGMAVWTPGRTQQHEPLTQAEHDFAFHEWQADGLLQWAPLAGRFQTVARAEDAAVLIAVTREAPATCAVDNAGTLGHLHWLLAGGPPALGCAPPSRPTPTSGAPWRRPRVADSRSAWVPSR